MDTIKEGMLPDFDAEAFVRMLEQEPHATVLLAQGGEPVDIATVKAKHIILMLDLIRNAMVMLRIKSTKDVQEAVKSLQEPTMLIGLIVEMIPKIQNISVELCSLTAEQWQELDLDQLMTLLWCQWIANEAFFTKTMPKMMRNLGIEGWSPELSEDGKEET